MQVTEAWLRPQATQWSSGQGWHPRSPPQVHGSLWWPGMMRGSVLETKRQVIESPAVSRARYLLAP